MCIQDPHLAKHVGDGAFHVIGAFSSASAGRRIKGSCMSISAKLTSHSSLATRGKVDPGDEQSVHIAYVQVYESMLCFDH